MLTVASQVESFVVRPTIFAYDLAKEAFADLKFGVNPRLPQALADSQVSSMLRIA